MTKRSQFVVMTALAAEAISMAPRLVVISGCGSRGVGLGVARQVLEQDSTAEVVVMARTLERAASVSAELGARAHAVACDVTDDESCEAVASAVEKLDVEKLHALVNKQTNATLRVLDCSHALPPPPKGSSRRDDTEAAKRERCVQDAQSKLKCKIYTKLKAEQV